MKLLEREVDVTNFLIIALLVVAIWGGYRHFDPYHARLPLDSTDLSTIRGSVDRLSAPDRDLLMAYVRRTGNHPRTDSILVAAQMSSMPTIGEAIALQKKFQAKESELNTELDARFAAYDAKFDAMNHALRIALVDTNYSADKPYLFRFTNTSTKTIKEFKARVLVRKAHASLIDFANYSAIAGFGYPFDRNRGFILYAGQSVPVLEPYSSVDIPAPYSSFRWFPLGKVQDGELILETYPTYILYSDESELRINDEEIKTLPNNEAIRAPLLKELY